MKFTRIFKETMLFWPSTIDISDGELLNDNSASFPTLSQVWDKAELSAGRWSEWHQLMVWAIFCGLRKLAMEELSKGSVAIKKNKIDVKYVEKKFSENLFTNAQPCYPRQMRRAYKNDLKP